MIDMQQAYDRWLDAHGQHHPVWDYYQLHTWLGGRHPRWMFLMGDELDALLGEAMQESWDEAQAAFDKRADQRRDAEDMENARTRHDEQMQKYGEDLRVGE